MKSYKEIVITGVKDDEADLFTGLLSNLDYSGFEQEDNILKAYIDSVDFDYVALKTIADEFQFQFSTNDIAEQNWNKVWESNFVPVQVDDFVGIRAYFHPPFGTEVTYELVITPKMSFGTGHHATTYMMIQQMQNLDFTGKNVLDFGTGTGVLAILAEKLGASYIKAIDNDAWSIENSEENITANDAKLVKLELASQISLSETYDIILANINRNVIIDNFDALGQILKPSGHLVLSGLLSDDESTILELAAKAGWTHLNTLRRLQWISILLTK